jgi:hypothetical protein
MTGRMPTAGDEVRFCQGNEGVSAEGRPKGVKAEMKLYRFLLWQHPKKAPPDKCLKTLVL